MSQAPLVQPPRIAVWLVDLFTPNGQAEAVPGELLEEFSNLASKSALASARRWYWRQSAKTIIVFIGAGFRKSPWLMIGTVLGGSLLLDFSTSNLQKAIVAVILFRSHHVTPYYDSNEVAAHFFWLRIGVLIGSLLEALIIGSIVAVATKGREMVSTIALSFIWVVMGAALFWLPVAMHGPVDPALFPAIMVQQLSASCMIVIGGVIVREIRSAMSRRPSATRKARADFKAFDKLMKRRRGQPPRQGDEIHGSRE
jgi:hypothetical protein